MQILDAVGDVFEFDCGLGFAEYFIFAFLELAEESAFFHVFEDEVYVVFVVEEAVES
jgi:hypothetical protein